MYAFPVTVVVRTDESIYPMDVVIDIDKIAVVKPLLDKSVCFGVESFPEADLMPASEIVFEDGRKLPVLETTATINRYLDAYRHLEDFYTSPPAAPAKPALEDRGVVIPLFGNQPCASSEASTPA